MSIEHPVGPSSTILSMGVVWLVVAVVVVSGGVALLRRLSARGRSADVDVGSVSEGWLSDQRGRKNS